jgi:hypothetical protein
MQLLNEVEDLKKKKALAEVIILTSFIIKNCLHALDSCKLSGDIAMTVETVQGTFRKRSHMTGSLLIQSQRKLKF